MKKLLKSTKIDYISIILIFIIINLMIVSKVKTLVVIPEVLYFIILYFY